MTEPVNHIMTITGKTGVIGDVAEQILNEAKVNRYGDDDIFSIHLALEEALVNAVKHGNKGDESKKIKIEYVISDRRLDIFITDEGAGFNPDKLPDPRIGDNLYKPCGRGVLLMRSYMDLVEYNETGNQVHMVKFRKERSV